MHAHASIDTGGMPESMPAWIPLLLGRNYSAGGPAEPERSSIGLTIFDKKMHKNALADASRPPSGAAAVADARPPSGAVPLALEDGPPQQLQSESPKLLAEESSSQRPSVGVGCIL